MVTDFDCWHPDHDVVDVPTVIKTLKQNASNAQNMMIEIIKTFESFNPKGDPANDLFRYCNYYSTKIPN